MSGVFEALTIEKYQAMGTLENRDKRKKNLDQLILELSAAWGDAPADREAVEDILRTALKLKGDK